MTYYEIWYCDDRGNKLQNISNVIQFEYVKVIGDVGLISLSTPIQGLLHESNQVDRRVHVYRAANGGSLKLDMVGFLQKFDYETIASGLNFFTTQGHDPNGLLNRRISAYNTEQSFATLDYAQVTSAMRGVVNRNLGTNATSPRDRTGDNLSLAPDIFFTPAVKQKIAWQNLLKTLQKLQLVSQNETESFFEMRPVSDEKIEFFVSNGVLGTDRSGEAVFSLENGNLVSPQLSYDWSDVKSYIYVGGKGEGASRNIQEVSDSERIGQSFWGRREKFRNATFVDIDDTAGLTDVGNDELAKFRPKITLTASLINTPSLQYGLDWNHGDKVTISYQNIQASTIIRSVYVSVGSDGRETISAKVELEL